MAAVGFSGLEMGKDEWVRQSWPARCHSESEDPGHSSAEGMLTLTNRRLLFTGRSELDEVLTFDFEEPLIVRWERHGVLSNSLIVETPSGQRFDFRAKKLACRQIAARAQMRKVATSRGPVVRLGSTVGEVGLTATK
jgi:hypothetical protein